MSAKASYQILHPAFPIFTLHEGHMHACSALTKKLRYGNSADKVGVAVDLSSETVEGSSWLHLPLWRRGRQSLQPHLWAGNSNFRFLHSYMHHKAFKCRFTALMSASVFFVRSQKIPFMLAFLPDSHVELSKQNKWRNLLLLIILASPYRITKSMRSLLRALTYSCLMKRRSTIAPSSVQWAYKSLAPRSKSRSMRMEKWQVQQCSLPYLALVKMSLLSICKWSNTCLHEVLVQKTICPLIIAVTACMTSEGFSCCKFLTLVKLTRSFSLLHWSFARLDPVRGVNCVYDCSCIEWRSCQPDCL